MHRVTLFWSCVVGLLAVSTALSIPGIPDQRDLSVKISRSSGTGFISFGFALVVLIALALFILLMGIIICYKRDTDIRSEDKTIFLTRF